MTGAIACGLEWRIEAIPTKPFDSPPELVARNPLSTIPTLVTDEGRPPFTAR